jgi:hypothetical protein
LNSFVPSFTFISITRDCFSMLEKNRWVHSALIATIKFFHYQVLRFDCMFFQFYSTLELYIEKCCYQTFSFGVELDWLTVYHWWNCVCCIFCRKMYKSFWFIFILLSAIMKIEENLCFFFLLFTNCTNLLRNFLYT